MINTHRYFMIILTAIFVALGWASTASAAQYTVKSGDNLWSISRQYNTTVADIKELNKLSSDFLKIGQTLTVPDGVAAPAAPATPEVSRTLRETDTPDVSRGGVLRRTVISNAMTYLGKPYRYGGMSPKGFDCSGFVGYIFKSCGITLPHNSAQQYNKGTKVEKSNLITGDLVFFKTGGSKNINHVGIYIGDNKFIHSATNRGISIDTLDSKYYSKAYVGAKRIIEL